MPEKTQNTLGIVGMSEAAKVKEVYGGSVDMTDAAQVRAAYKRIGETEKLLRDKLQGKRPGLHLDMNEAVHAADFQILFPNVVSAELMTPSEPTFVGQMLLAKTIKVEGSTIFEVPKMGTIRAAELHDTQEPPERDPSFTKEMTEIRVRRFGVKLEVTNEVITRSQWDVLGMYIREAGNAMRRKKEELIFNEYTTRAVVQFDNTLTDTTKNTTGKASDGTTANGTMSHMDLLDMMASLGANGYTPTDVLLHPLGWVIWAKDPFLRFQLINKGSVGDNVGTFNGGGADMNANTFVPFGLNVVVSPFQDVTYGNTLATGVTGQGSSNHTSVTVVDRGSSMLIAQASPMQMVKYDNVLRDIQGMAFFEKYGLALINGGRAAVIAKNIRLDLNHEPVYTINTV